MLIRSVFCVLSVMFLCSFSSVNALDEKESPEKEAPKLETAIDKTSYAIGFNIGSDLKRQGLEVSPETMALGIAAALAGSESALTPQETEEVFSALQAEMAKKKAAMSAKVQEAGKKNLDAGKKYLAENKAKEGVKTTKSGLQYMVIEEGKGAVPTKSSTVSTHYRGTLIDGTVFDSSFKGDAPAEGDMPVSFGVTQVIKGWTEALQLMKTGSHYRLFIPSELAYGENGPPSIGANSTLIFEIYLIDSQD